MRNILVWVFLLTSLSTNADEIVFEGYPVKKIETNENSSNVSLLSQSQASEYKVTIIKEGDKFYWATRGNLEVVPMKSGFYITYLAVNGAGYVRTMTPEMRGLFKMMPPEEQEKQFLYFEHLVHQMGSITYYGK